MAGADIFNIAEEALGQGLSGLKPITGQGEGNEVWEVTRGQEAFILRCNASPGSFGIFQKEAWCMAAAAKAGIPGASPAGMGMTGETAWMLQTKIAGVPGNLWKGDPLTLWREMGRLGAMLNAIPVDGYGNRMVFPEDAPPRFDKTWPQTADWFLSELFSDDSLVRSGTLTERQNAKAREIVSRMQAWDFPSTLCHYDILPKNIIVGLSGKMHLIDYGLAAGSRSPHGELVNICTFGKSGKMLGAFCEGYGITSADFAAMQPELSQLFLARILLHARWAYLQDGPRKEDHIASMRAKAADIIDKGIFAAAQPAFPAP